MTQILITAGFFLLVLISLFMILVVLMQRANTNAGLGAAFGGGITESAFGTEATNILQKATRWTAIAFFIIAFALYLGILADHSQPASEAPVLRFEDDANANAAEAAVPANASEGSDQPANTPANNAEQPAQ